MLSLATNKDKCRENLIKTYPRKKQVEQYEC